MINNRSLDLGGRGEDIGTHLMAPQNPVHVGRWNWWKPEKLTAKFTFSSIHKLKFHVYHEARQSRQVKGVIRLGPGGKQ